MKKPLRGLALLVLALVVAIQLFPADRANSPARAEILAPPAVLEVLQRSCYDCHTGQTRWPWYSRVAPVSWYVARHVHEAREHLNLTEWPVIDPQAQLYYLTEMKEEVLEGEMPLDSYLLLHSDARLSDADRDLLVGWIDREIALLSEL